MFMLELQSYIIHVHVHVQCIEHSIVTTGLGFMDFT